MEPACAKSRPLQAANSRQKGLPFFRDENGVRVLVVVEYLRVAPPGDDGFEQLFRLVVRKKDGEFLEENILVDAPGFFQAPADYLEEAQFEKLAGEDRFAPGVVRGEETPAEFGEIHLVLGRIDQFEHLGALDGGDGVAEFLA